MSSALSVDKFAESLLQRSGLFDVMHLVVEQIEEELSGSYDVSDDDEDEADSTPYYGGVIYTIYEYCNDGDYDYRIEDKLKREQKRFFEKIIKGKTCRFNVERVGYEQKWEIFLNPEIAPNSDERLDIVVNIEISVFSPKKYTLTAINNTANTAENYDEILFLMTLAS